MAMTLTFEAPVAAENIRKEPFILRCKSTVNLVVGTHELCMAVLFLPQFRWHDFKEQWEVADFYKRNLDSNIECCTIMLTEPTTPLIFMRNPVGLFICGLFYVSVSKTIINNKIVLLYVLEQR